jgi:hypothetical protein
MHPHEPTFQESNLRTTKLKDLGLTIAGTMLEPVINEFMLELDAAGLSRVRPRVYLSTEWGVPFGTIAIGVPFYLARPDLIALHAEQTSHVEGVGRADILRYLRHEMGHVVNYAYRLYEREDWIQTFGSMTQPYLEEYRPQPFSRRFVRHLPGWYAQKHPDEDWAETFAVWMTPGLDWRARYASWPTALLKIEYCDRIVREVARHDPPERSDELDEDVGELNYSAEDLYKRLTSGTEELPAGLAGALSAIFEDLGLSDAPAGSALKPASALIRRLEPDLVANVFRWTGHFPERTRPLVRRLAELADELKQGFPADREAAATVAFTTLVTALAMNHVHGGTYLP